MAIFGGFDREPDRRWKNNMTDGKTYYGYDDGKGIVKSR